MLIYNDWKSGLWYRVVKTEVVEAMALYRSWKSYKANNVRLNHRSSRI